MAQLQSTNVTGVLCVNGVAVGGGKDFKFCCFTTSTTWTPSSDLVDGNGFIEADVVGGGGGGGAGAHRVRICSNVCCTTNGESGAGGGFLRDLINIDSTDACTVTIGAGGTSGSVSGSYQSDACYLDIYAAMNDTNIIPGGDGGNSVFGGLTAYGGCGGSSRGMSSNNDGTNNGVITCACTISSTITSAGQYGGFREVLGACNRGLTIGPSTGCGDNTTGCISGIGVQGASWNRRCATFPGCSIDANVSFPSPSVTSGTTCTVNGVPAQSLTYGNGAGAGGAKSYAGGGSYSNRCSLGEVSGSEGQQGIVVLRWQE